jgi:hypothetical protein
MLWQQILCMQISTKESISYIPSIEYESHFPFPPSSNIGSGELTVQMVTKANMYQGNTRMAEISLLFLYIFLTFLSLLFPVFRSYLLLL